METVKNPYFSMMDFDMNPSQEQAAAANKFNKMIASIQFAGEKFNEDGSNTEEYKLFLSWKTQPNEVIMTADQHKKCQGMQKLMRLLKLVMITIHQKIS